MKRSVSCDWMKGSGSRSQSLHWSEYTNTYMRSDTRKVCVYIWMCTQRKLKKLRRTSDQTKNTKPASIFGKVKYVCTYARMHLLLCVCMYMANVQSRSTPWKSRKNKTAQIYIHTCTKGIYFATVYMYMCVYILEEERQAKTIMLFFHYGITKEKHQEGVRIGLNRLG